MNSEFQIFISYAKDDKEKAKELYRQLSAAGFKPWMDTEDLLPGFRWEFRIEKAIRKSNCFLACLSEGSVKKRGYFQKEIRMALEIADEMLDSDVYLIPARLENCEVPSRLLKFHWVDLFEDSGFTKLTNMLQGEIDKIKKEGAKWVTPFDTISIEEPVKPPPERSGNQKTQVSNLIDAEEYNRKKGNASKLGSLVLSHEIPPKFKPQRGFKILLDTPIGCKLLDFEITFDFYARIGFRFICASSLVEENLIARELINFHDRIGNFANVYNTCIRIGYEAYISSKEIVTIVDRLRDPRYRIVCELFWPHLSNELFRPIKTERDLASPRGIRALIEAADKSDGLDGVLAKHALAIIYHNLALKHELAYAAGEINWSNRDWLKALSYWTEVINSDCFWDHLRKRAASFNHLSLNQDEVEILREQLPNVLLGFNTFLARSYVKQAAVCAHHLAIIEQSGLPANVKCETVVAVIKDIAVARLEPLILRANKELIEITGKLNRKKFDTSCKALLKEALAVRNYLISNLQLSEEMVKIPEFDNLCEAIINGLHAKLDYDTNEQLRNILYCILVTKKILELPVSWAMRNKLKESIANDTDKLYGDFNPFGKKFDATRCWFIDGEEADPDISLEFRVKRLHLNPTRRKTLYVESQKILVPRSQAAADQHLKTFRRDTQEAFPTMSWQAYIWTQVLAFLAFLIERFNVFLAFDTKLAKHKVRPVFQVQDFPPCQQAEELGYRLDLKPLGY